MMALVNAFRFGSFQVDEFEIVQGRESQLPWIRKNKISKSLWESGYYDTPKSSKVLARVQRFRSKGQKFISGSIKGLERQIAHGGLHMSLRSHYLSARTSKSTYDKTLAPQICFPKSVPCASLWCCRTSWCSILGNQVMMWSHSFLIFNLNNSSWHYTSRCRMAYFP